jgi:hypothetical protein
MKFTQVLFASLAIFTMMGCKTIDIKDGRIPSQYLSQAKKLAGVYKGEFNGVAGELEIAFYGNKPVLTYRNNRGDDLLNNNCHSVFGNLRKVTVRNENKKPEVRNAEFDFNAGACSLIVVGREISLSFKDTDKGLRVNLTLLKELRQREVCSWNPGNPPNVPPSQNCHWEQDPTYLYGRFVK